MVSFIKKIKNKRAAAGGISAAAATLIMASSNIGSRLLGFIRLQVLANTGGASSQVDAYAFSFILPDLINHLLAGSALSITFIPIFQKYIVTGDHKRAWRIFSNILTIGTAGFIILITASFFYTEELVSLAGKNVSDPDDPSQLLLVSKLTRIILPAQLFFFWGALLNGVQYAQKRFVLPALTPLVYNAGIITGGVVLYPFIGIEGFSWGVLAGAFVGNVVIQIYGAAKAGMSYKFVFDLKDRDFLKYLMITLPFILGLGMTFSNEFFIKYFGSFVPHGEGVISSLNYGYKIMFFSVGILGQSVAAGYYPFITQLILENKLQSVSDLLLKLFSRVGSLLIPVSVITMVLSRNIVSILLQRGEFDSAATGKTAAALLMYMPGAFFCSGALIISRVFYAMKKTLLPLMLSTISIAVTIPVYIYLGRLLKGPGLAIAASVYMFLLFIILLSVYSKKYSPGLVSSILSKITLICLYSIPGMILCFYLKIFVSQSIYFIESEFIVNLLICIIAGIPSFLITILITDFTKMTDFRSIFINLTRGGNRKSDKR